MDSMTRILVAAGAIILIIIAAVAIQSAEDAGAVGTPNAHLSKEACESARGHWNECSPTCRNLQPDQSCAQVCAQECECGGIAGFGCPEGFVCTDYFPSKETPDAMGVCKKQ